MPFRRHSPVSLGERQGEGLEEMPPFTATHTVPKSYSCPRLSLSPILWPRLACLWGGMATGQTAHTRHHQPGAEGSLGSRGNRAGML